MTASAAIGISRLTHRYGSRVALDALDLDIAPGELFAILGPNGSGKTTLFRLLSTLTAPQQGSIEVLGCDIVRDRRAVQQSLGVVFQAPSLDKKLTVRENLRYHGPLVGLWGRALDEATTELLARFDVADRAADLAETLSGGLRRRVELAKGLLHRPPLLLLDEPSTGLDPGARNDLWRYLRELREHDGVTIVLTTHLLEEADRADRLAIFDRGKLVALDAPDRLRATVAGDSITIETADPAALVGELSRQLGLAAAVVDGRVRLEHPDGPRLVPRIMDACSARIQAITLGRPTLEDVFIARTGRRMQNDE
ncbi:MAG TPA: ATP-binding cassette domain-containing protein [Pirellulales bacterium]|jgi:ABC-2 type transport system ATP-binding protein|nr:ATP-binding cassette domain-containing protein [Pirellulales bacterium]